jgi:hypothetical protein
LNSAAKVTSQAVVMVEASSHGARVKSRPAVLLRLAATAAWMISGSSLALAAEWNVASFTDESTLEFRTAHAEGDHWSTVWFVELDGEIYLNLGDRAVERLRTNTAAPLVSIRVDDVEYEKIRVEAAQDRQPEVAQAMADKYWTGFLIPHRRPSTVMRLKPE